MNDRRPDTPLQPETLLEHTAFVRRVAAGLLGDPADAEDLTQEVMLAAWRRRPRKPGAVRSWLRRTAHNVRANMVRARHRREFHESAAAAEAARTEPPGDTAPVAEVIEREEIRRRVIEHVVRLEEPYRSVVLMRYLEGRTSTAIATRLGRPAGTVRSQLKTGLAKLRARMDGEHHGDRRAWAVPLATSVGLPVDGATGSVPESRGSAPATRPPAVPGPPAMWIAGLTTMVAVTLSLVVLGGLRQEPVPPDAAGSAGRSPGASVGGVPTPSPGNRKTVAAADEAPGETAAEGPPRLDYPIDRPTQRLTGIVVAARTGRPVAADLRIESVPLHGGRAFTIVDDRSVDHRIRSGTDGRFRFEGPAGLYRITATTGDGRRALAHAVTEPLRAAASLGATPLRLEVRREHELDRAVFVEVFDDSGGPVPGAEVGLSGRDPFFGPIGYLGRTPLRQRTDGEGRAVLRADRRLERLFEGLVSVRGPEGTVGVATIPRPEHGNGRPWVQIVLGAPGRIEGKVTGPRPEGAVEVVALLSLVYGNVYRDAEGSVRGTVENGTYRIEGVPPGRYCLRVVSEEGLCPVREPSRFRSSGLDALTVQVEAGAAARADLELQRGGAVRGRVLGGDGRPIARAFVQAHRIPDEDDRSPKEWPCATDSNVDEWCRTTAQGGFALAGLQPGRQLLTIEAVGFAQWRGTVELARGETHACGDLVLQPGGRIEGIVADGRSVRIAPVVPPGAGSAVPELRVHAGSREVFASPDLPAGTYRIEPVGREGTIQPGCGVRVRAGRSTWVDLRRLVACTVTGRVVGPAGPLVDALVRASRGSKDRVVRTGGDGTFRLPVPTAGSPIWLTVERNGVRIAERRIEPGQDPLDLGHIRVDGVRVVVRTVTAGGRPRPARLRLRTESRFPQDPPPPVSSRGTAVFDFVDPDHLRIHASFPSGFETFRQVFGPDAAGPEPPATVEVELVEPPTGTVELDVTDHLGRPAPGRSFVLYSWSGPGPAPRDPRAFAEHRHFLRRAISATDGRIVLHGVPAGPVLVHRGGRMQERYGFGSSDDEPPPYAEVLDVPAGGTVQRRVALPAEDVAR